MRMYDIIDAKKRGQELSKEQIEFFIKGYTNSEIPDYQASALLMAIMFNGMNENETFFLTKNIIESGHTFDLTKINGIKVDKHSTGGVGDTTSLILGPIVASLGIPVAKMSGRGLGHTGGTLDKLSAIPGFTSELTTDEFIKIVNECGIAICAQTMDVTPADKKLYALRDATATVDNLSLIASSIMGKKLAMGADAILLDVKVGSGAFMKTYDDALKLAEIMVALGKKFNKNTQAIITNMEQPLGKAIGNSLEIIEAIDTLRGNGPEDLTELCVIFATKLVILADNAKCEDEAKKMVLNSITSGKAYEKFMEMVKYQHGDISYISDKEKLMNAKYIENVYAKESGYISKIDALSVGHAAMILGAGRETKEEQIDLSAGILLNKKIGEHVTENELIATLFTNKYEKISESKSILTNCIDINKENIQSQKVILGEVK